MELILWTNNAELAREADAAGVKHIGVDLEHVGKKERQGHLSGCWISNHSEEDLITIKQNLSNASLFIRTNPVHPGLGDEIDRLIGLGSETLMLPMFYTAEEARYFVDRVRGRARVVLQVETIEAVQAIDKILDINGVDSVFIGLNDLSISMGISNRFSLLYTDMMEDLSKKICKKGVQFGFGGIARIDDDTLPTPSDLVYAQYPRLNATSALIARVFLRRPDPVKFFSNDYQQAVSKISYWEQAPDHVLEEASSRLKSYIDGKQVQ